MPVMEVAQEHSLRPLGGGGYKLHYGGRGGKANHFDLIALRPLR